MIPTKALLLDGNHLQKFVLFHQPSRFQTFLFLLFDLRRSYWDIQVKFTEMKVVLLEM